MGYFNEQTKKNIDAFIAANKGQILDDLLTLVRIPSVRSEAKENAPFGEACAKALEASAALFEREGLQTRIEKQYGYAVSYLGDGDEDFGLFGHADVVPADGNWTVNEDPFAPVIRDGFVFGRGCDDDKAGIICSLYAAKYIKENGIRLNRRLVCFTGTNEESGMQDMRDFVAHERIPTRSLVPDGSYPFGYGEKAICRFWLTADEPFDTIVRIDGGNCFNAVLGKAVATLPKNAALLDELTAKAAGNERITVEEADGIITVMATGITAHAAHPEGALDAGYVLFDFLTNIASLGDHDKDILQKVLPLLITFDGSPFGMDAEAPILGCTTCANGMLRTENGHLHLSFDARIAAMEKVDAMLVSAEKAAKKCGCSFKLFSRSGGYLRDLSTPLAKALLDAYIGVTGETEAKPFVMQGGTYAKYLPEAFATSMKVHAGRELPVLPAGHGRAHQPDEFISVDGICEAIGIFICMIIDADNAD